MRHRLVKGYTVPTWTHMQVRRHAAPTPSGDHTPYVNSIQQEQFPMRKIQKLHDVHSLRTAQSLVLLATQSCVGVGHFDVQLLGTLHDLLTLP